MFLTILFYLLLASILHFCLKHYRKSVRLINLLPGPPAIPFFGNVFSLQVSGKEIWLLTKKWGAQYYPIYRILLLTKLYIFIRHPDDFETILRNPKYNRKGQTYKLLEPWFNTGLLTSSGSKWQTRRKILTPAFHFNVLQQFIEILIEEGKSLVETLRRERGSVVKDLLPLISEHTLNVICETAMGTSLKDKGTFEHKYRSAVHSIGNIILYRLLKPWFYLDILFNLCPQGWRQRAVLKILHGFTRQIIQERKMYHDRTNGQYLKNINVTPDETNDTYTGYRKKRLAMLDLLLAAHQNNQIDDEGIREEVDTFMFRGHDTSGVSLCFTIMLLAEHKEIQDRVRAEVKNVMDESGGELDMSALQNLSYLERCIKESLRLYPSVPIIFRRIEHDIVLSNTTIPAGAEAVLRIVDLHRDPEYWPNPYVFDPDRFLPENSLGRHPYSYLPFSAGSRNCIGQRFAMFELKVTLAYLLHNFIFEPVDYLKDLIITTDLVIRPSHPIRTKFIPLGVSS